MFRLFYATPVKLGVAPFFRFDKLELAEKCPDYFRWTRTPKEWNKLGVEEETLCYLRYPDWPCETSQRTYSLCAAKVGNNYFPGFAKHEEKNQICRANVNGTIHLDSTTQLYLESNIVSFDGIGKNVLAPGTPWNGMNLSICSHNYYDFQNDDVEYTIARKGNWIGYTYPGAGGCFTPSSNGSYATYKELKIKV